MTLQDNVNTVFWVLGEMSILTPPVFYKNLLGEHS